MRHYVDMDHRVEAQEERLQRRCASRRETVAQARRADEKQQARATLSGKRPAKQRQYSEAARRRVAKRIPAIILKKFDGNLKGEMSIVLLELKRFGAIKDPTWRNAGERQQLVQDALDLCVRRETVSMFIDKQLIVSLSVEPAPSDQVEQTPPPTTTTDWSDVNLPAYYGTRRRHAALMELTHH
ncbi:hypothetical protein HY312_03055 [Candidatus Saccharibacteria bacterium]|nr:hypothetical protein [Candidatus Saccharibacteria bacterium]